MNDTSEAPETVLVYDQAINYAFQQNAIPVVKELRFRNDATLRKNLVLRIFTEPAFAEPVELRLQAIEPDGEFRVAPLDLKLSPDFLAKLNEKVSGWLKCEVVEGDSVLCSRTDPISLLARNEWCGLVSLPEILAAFILPNDTAVMTILNRGAELLREHTGRSAFNGYQDKSRKRAWEQVAAIYKAVSELGIRYIVAPASFENTGQKVRTPADIMSQRFANCLDLSLLFCACCEQVGLHPLVLMHESHAYAGCWLEERTLPEASSDDLQHIRKLVADELVAVFECTTVTNETPGTLKDAELLAQPHLQGGKPFRLALDVRRARLARIHPLPSPNQTAELTGGAGATVRPTVEVGIGNRDFAEPLKVEPKISVKSATRIDQWKSRLLDLSLRNRLLNFRETKAAVRILSNSPENVEDELAAERELLLRPRPKVMGEDDPRSEAAYTQQQRADALAEHLSDELKQGRLHTHIDETEHARRLPKWLHIANVRRHLQTARSDQTKLDAATMGEVLKAALRLRTVNAELVAAAPKAEPLLGPIWSRGETQLDHLIQVRAWGVAFEERLVSLAGEDSAWLDQLRKLIASLFKQGTASYEVGTVIGNRLNRYREAITKFDAAYETLLTSADIRRGPLEDAADHLSTLASTVSVFQTDAARLRAINSELHPAAAIAQDCLGILWAKGEPNADAVARARAWGETLHARMLACAGDDLCWLEQLRQLLASLFAEGPAVYAANTTIGARLVRYRDTQAEFNAAFTALVSEVRLRRESLDSAPDHLTAIQRLVQRIPSAWHQIREWCFWQKVRSEATKLGLSTVIARLESPGGDAMDISNLFERSFRREFFFAVVEREAALREFFGREQNERIDRFREVDEKIAELTREIIRIRLAAGIPRDQGHDDIPKTEIGLLRREISKKMRHIPVRQLLSRIPNLLPRLKPCVLMSPLSVAQYLEPSHAIFDVVIFDEASQIPVWDAIGAIARGQQLIVVGDPKQLPPTNFFNSAGDDEDSLAPEEFKDLESILDELMSNQMRHKRLQWHYRSRHEGLITFSNRQYYENALLTFPSAEITQGGVKFRHLPEARYDKGKSRTNRGEADALVAELIARLRNPDGPRRSYGVVTFSLAQQQLIENLLDEERRKYPEIEVHFGDEPPVEGEPVFVKNLENVQGDERDVIFFSICYGVDESGRVAMNFGPLNRDGGERRLNVAITRAKHEVLVFSGLRADQIDLTRTRARGLRD
jgi:AAA domain/Protein of unknown function (DUF4011)